MTECFHVSPALKELEQGSFSGAGRSNTERLNNKI